MPETYTIGGAREFLAQAGRIPGRSESDLLSAVKQAIANKSKNTSGKVTTLCTSPDNGTRCPCDSLKVKQSIVGDCQHPDGFQCPEKAKIKNSGALLGVAEPSDENMNAFVESLLCAVSLGDQDIVQQVVQGLQAPRMDKVWATGDNIYVSGLDMSWSNFHIGDLLVMSNAVIVNTGYPHSACWKYGARAGDQPKDCVNSKEGMNLRMRGIKGAFLLPSSAGAAGSVNINDNIRVVRAGTSELKEVLQDCRTPLPEDMDLVFSINGKTARAKASDTQAYYELLVCAGIESGKIDQAKYKRNRGDLELQELGLQEKPMEISPAARSGDGTLENVGIKVDGKFKSPVNNQCFDTQQALDLHMKYLHDPRKAGPAVEE
jgi:hypothetical protein